VSAELVTPAYRRDIDGLRGVAVATVVLFHAHVPGFGGGYVGVDVFFVISGYLITLLLLGSAHQPLRASLANFYIRRSRRILPALMVVSLIAAAAASVLLLPWALVRFGRYLVATALLVPNIAAWFEGYNYFRSFGENVALLHYWSIAIEEQFYLIYPLALVLVSRYLPRHRTPVLLLIAAASFALCAWSSYYHPVANYYLAPSRVWELLLGAAIATSQAPLIRSQATGELLAATGLATLIAVVFLYSPDTRYPGIYTLAPCAAAAALIVAGQQRCTLAGRLLSLRPIVFTGLISYSLYLWHFVLETLFVYYHVVEVTALQTAALIGVMYLLAYVSWKVIETPIRRRRFLKSNRTFVQWAVACNAVVFAAGWVMWASHGLPGRFPPEFQTEGRMWNLPRDDIMHCINLTRDEIASGQLCSFGPQNNSVPRVLVWGDSHVMSLFNAYAKLADQHQVRVYISANSSCRPLLDLTDVSIPEMARDRCAEVNTATVQAIERLRPSVVILNARWLVPDSQLIPPAQADPAPGESNLMFGLQRSVEAVQAPGRSICAVLDVPDYKYDLPYVIATARRRGLGESFLQLSLAEAQAQLRQSELDLRALERQGKLFTVDPKQVLCRSGSCEYEHGDTLLYVDANHLSWQGALWVSGEIDRCFEAH
jgi:peptidoglycan/LPS O-acetylase OafA/YrhL